MARFLPLIVLATLLAATEAAPAQTRIYKWIDDDGVTHYTQHPPPEGEAVVMDPDTGTSTRPPKPSRPATGGGAEADDDEETAAGGSGDPETIEEYCAQIRERVQLLAGDEPVRLKRDDGTLQTLEGEAREARRTELEAQIAEHCSEG